MSLLLGIGEKLYDDFKGKKKKRQQRAYQRGFAAGQESVGGGLGMKQMTNGGQVGEGDFGKGVSINGSSISYGS